MVIYNDVGVLLISYLHKHLVVYLNMKCRVFMQNKDNDAFEMHLLVLLCHFFRIATAFSFFKNFSFSLIVAKMTKNSIPRHIYAYLPICS